jgi:hypothetical protein
MGSEGDAMTGSYEEWQKEYQAERERNIRAFAEQRERIRRDYAGQYVGFAFGRVITADPDEKKVIEAMDALDPQPESSAVFRAGEEPVFEIIEDYWVEFLPE